MILGRSAIMTLMAMGLACLPAVADREAVRDRYNPLFLTISSDGSYALTVQDGYCLALWNLAARQLEWHTWVGGDGQDKPVVPFATFSPDGKHVITWGGIDNKVRILAKATGKEVRSFAIDHRYVECLVLSADGKQMLTGGGADPLKLWSMADGKQIRAFQGGEGTVHLALSADGKYALAQEGFGLGGLKLWDVATGKELWAVKKYSGLGAATVAFSPDGKHVLSGGHDAYVEIRKLRDGELVRAIQVGEANELWTASVISAVYTVTGRYILVAAQAEPLKLYEVATGQVALTFNSEKGFHWPIVPAPDGKHVLSIGDRGGHGLWTPSLWDLRNGKEIGPIVETGKE